MGKATIISAIAGGQYNVTINFDRTRSDAEIALMQTQNITIAARLAELTTELTTAALAVDSAQTILQVAITNYTAETGGQAEVTAAQADVSAKLGIYRNLGQVRSIARLKKLANTKRIAWLQQAVVADINTTAWCADFNDSLSGEVGLIEVGRKQGTNIIKPGGENGNLAGYTAVTDGKYEQAASSTPAGVFYNLAMQPGAGKWRPRYRTGTITAIDTAADTADITLHPATSSGLGINQTSILSAVPVVYMSCNAAAFDVGAAVIIEFIGMDWAHPQIVGFVDNPQPCGQFEYWLIKALSTSQPAANPWCGAWRTNSLTAFKTSSLVAYTYIDQHLPGTQVYGDLLLAIDPPDDNVDVWRAKAHNLVSGITTTWRDYAYANTLSGVCCNPTRRFYGYKGNNGTFTSGTYHGYSAEIDITDHADGPVATISINDAQIVSIACSDTRLAVCYQLVHLGRWIDQTGVPIDGTSTRYYTTVVDFFDLSGNFIGRHGTITPEVSDNLKWYHIMFGGPSLILGYGTNGSAIFDRVDVMQPNAIAETYSYTPNHAPTMLRGMVVDDLVFALEDWTVEGFQLRIYRRVDTNSNFGYDSTIFEPTALQALSTHWYHARIKRPAL